MNKPRKHAELIKAYADGAEIELKFPDGIWYYSPCPRWHEDYEYRIKPEPKPDVVMYGMAHRENVGFFSSYKWSGENLKLTFDGETGKLKAAEVLQ